MGNDSLAALTGLTLSATETVSCALGLKTWIEGWMRSNDDLDDSTEDEEDGTREALSGDSDGNTCEALKGFPDPG